MLGSELSPHSLCELIAALPPEERYERLKALDGNTLFVEVMRLLPSKLRWEFGRFEMLAEIASCLIRLVSMATMRQLIERRPHDFGPESLRLLLETWTEGDEFWLFESIPGAKGYALLRGGQIIDFCVLETTCISQEVETRWDGP